MKPMLGIRYSLLVFAIALGGGMAGTRSAQACGSDTTACEQGQKCCQHRVATFCENEACSSVHLEGQCIPEENSCDTFWCGNRQCQTTWLMSRDVCCIYYPTGSTPDYSCSGSELSCRGNTAQLTIRPQTVASADLSDE